MRAAAVFGALATAAASGGGTVKLAWSDCGDSSTHGRITSLSPDSLTLGSKTSLTGKGSVDEAITGATYKVSAKAGPVPVFSHNGDACKPETIKLPAGAGEIDMKGFKCPLSKGDVELDLDVNLSSAIPSSLARVTIDLTATASSGDKALCVEIKTSPGITDEDRKEVAPESPPPTPAPASDKVWLCGHNKRHHPPQCFQVKPGTDTAKTLAECQKDCHTEVVV